MTGPTHAITGLAAVVVLARVSGVTPDSLGLLALLCGVLAPDIDGSGVITKPGTILRRFVGHTVGELIDLVFGLFVGLVHLCFRHRGLIHSPILAVSLFGVANVSDYPRLELFAIGYAVHLLGDLATRGGIPVLAPFSKRRHSVCAMKTGSRQEAVFAVTLLLVVGVTGWELLPEAVKQTHSQLLDSISANIRESHQQIAD